MLRGGKHTKSILLFLVPKIMAFGNTLSFLFIAVGGTGERVCDGKKTEEINRTKSGVTSPQTEEQDTF